MEVTVILREKGISKISLLTLRKALLLKESDQEKEITFEVKILTSSDGSVLEKEERMILPALEIFSLRPNPIIESFTFFTNYPLIAKSLIEKSNQLKIVEDHFSAIYLTKEINRKERFYQFDLIYPYLIKDLDQYEFLYLLSSKLNQYLEEKIIKKDFVFDNLDNLLVLLNCFFSRDNFEINKEELTKALRRYLNKYLDIGFGYVDKLNRKLILTPISEFFISLNYDSIVYQDRAFYLRIEYLQDMLIFEETNKYRE